MKAEELKVMLNYQWLLEGDGIKPQFQKLANIFLQDVLIQKGKSKYRLTDIEFYFYCEGHKDIITYPRNCEAGQWFFHNSGVDITFESKVKTTIKPTTKKLMPHLNNDSFFGGILIKGIENITDRDESKQDGPMKSCEKLFDSFDAFGNVNNFPKIIFESHNLKDNIKQTARHNLFPKDKTIEEKVKSILNNNYYGYDTDVDELNNCFKEFMSAEYRFIL